LLNLSKFISLLVAGKTSCVTNVVGGVVQRAGLNVASKDNDTKTKDHGGHKGQKGRFAGGVNQYSHFLVSIIPLS